MALKVVMRYGFVCVWVSVEILIRNNKKQTNNNKKQTNEKDYSRAKNLGSFSGFFWFLSN